MGVTFFLLSTSLHLGIAYAVNQVFSFTGYEGYFSYFFGLTCYYNYYIAKAVAIEYDKVKNGNTANKENEDGTNKD